MSQLSWNEIRNNAIKFSRDWAGTTEERAESQSFWNDFFQVFGLSRKLLATFEQPVVSFEGTKHRIDVYWKGTLLAEHKSAGVSLGKALDQALTYVQELEAGGARGSLPRYILLSDFNRILLHDLAPDDGAPGERRLIADFPLADFHENVRHFAFMIGQKTHRFGDEDPANIEATEIMADLHDAVKEGGYDQAFLERFLVRILFCLFADDTGIFEPGQFELYIANHTKEDGSDLGGKLRDLFEILDTPPEKRSKYLDEDLAAFPYVNGELFAGQSPLAGFNRDMRNRLVAALHFDWSRISPAIFGSLFQGIMDGKERRQIGAHYTSERDILKLIRPLFLDALQEEFDKIAKLQRGREERLRAFQKKLRSLNFLDPACGCGNFLVIAYRELRKLETAALKLLYNFDKRGQDLDLGEVAKLSHVDVDQFYGIEIGEWPARIAETALWLTDHQMNTQLSLAAGNTYQRIPLRAAPHIRCANALRMDWNDLLPAKECSYVLGNPPFIGHHYQSKEQKEDQQRVMHNISARGVLDYVCNWYVKAAEYIGQLPIQCAFVSTNSISQGEQAGILWSELFARYGLKINFAHRTFSWQSEAKGKAHVHVVIIGFSTHELTPKRLFDYQVLTGDPEEKTAINISPYLCEGPNLVLPNRTNPLCPVPRMRWGNKPTDGGHLILSPEERDELLSKEPDASKYIKRYMSGGDL